jgi:hypothetical protein
MIAAVNNAEGAMVENCTAANSAFTSVTISKQMRRRVQMGMAHHHEAWHQEAWHQDILHQKVLPLQGRDGYELPSSGKALTEHDILL